MAEAPSRSRAPSFGSEVLAAAEFARLMADPLYYGVGGPRGDGRLATVLPGLFASDFYLRPMRVWLRRLGFRAIASSISANVGCPQELCLRVEAELEANKREHPVVLIGHSRGGMLAKAIAARMQDDVSHLVLLGSPVGGLLRSGWYDARSRIGANQLVVEAAGRARRRASPDCNVPNCGCPYPADFQRPLSKQTKVFSIYTRDDPIVPPAACRVDGATNIEVSGTHSGLAWNPAVYRAIARALADGDDSSRTQT